MTRRSPPSRRWRDGAPIPGSRPPPVGPELIPAPWWLGREGVSVTVRVPGHAIGKFCAQRASGLLVQTTDTVWEYPPESCGAIAPRHRSRPVPPTRRSIESPRVGRPRAMVGRIATRPRLFRTRLRCRVPPSIGGGGELLMKRVASYRGQSNPDASGGSYIRHPSGGVGAVPDRDSVSRRPGTADFPVGESFFRGELRPPENSAPTRKSAVRGGGLRVGPRSGAFSCPVRRGNDHWAGGTSRK